MASAEQWTSGAEAGLSWQVRCRWVPGTLDRVRLVAPAGDGRERSEVEMDLEQFGRLAGRDAIAALYLYGWASFECDRGLWQAIRAVGLPLVRRGWEPAGGIA